MAVTGGSAGEPRGTVTAALCNVSTTRTTKQWRGSAAWRRATFSSRNATAEVASRKILKKYTVGPSGLPAVRTSMAR